MTTFRPASRSSSPERSPSPGLFSMTQIRHLMRVEFSRAQRYRYPLACLVLTVDDLERVRDTEGYDAKEALLESVIALLQRETRVCDYLGRLADDRLMAVLPHTPADGARAAAERLLAAARAGAGADGRATTLSVGGSAYQDDNTLFFDALLEAAEDAVRDAELGGGDRYVAHVPGLSG